MGSTSADSSPLHALVVPYPTQSHIIPMMQFAKNLASRGVIVTFVTTHYTHARIAKAQDSQVDDPLGLQIRSAQISDGLPLDFDRSAHLFDFFRSVDNNMGEELEKFIQNLNKSHPISCVIADTLLFWSFDVTKKFGLPWISFWTQPAIIYSIYYHANLLEAHSQSIFKGSGTEDNILIDYIPGVPPLQPRDLPSFFWQRNTDSDYVLDLLMKSFQSSRAADWVLCNSFDGLDSPAVNALMSLKHPVFLVGPQLPSGYFNGRSTDKGTRPGTMILTESDPSAWLDTKPNGSVIYVSFGSMTRPSKAQLEEIAIGLKNSRQPFLWVLRPDMVTSTVSDSLPEGFLDEIGSQCLIVPWCNQLQVLSHPSVAGFITHCGWNSMLESISLGVPMIGLPFWSEQYTNCLLMADEWNLGISLRDGGGDSKVISRDDICSAVRKLVSDEGKEMKRNAEALRDSAKTAMLEGGSSQKNTDSFVLALKQRCV